MAGADSTQQAEALRAAETLQRSSVRRAAGDGWRMTGKRNKGKEEAAFRNDFFRVLGPRLSQRQS